VIGIPDEIKGEAIKAFVVLRPREEDEQEMKQMHRRPRAP
jgi:acyl-coenzyme A synthetase/AMP-(fatty) acid ligase